MSLNSDLTACKDWQELTGDTPVGHKTHGIILMTMAIGMREITEKNFEEFYLRIHLIERVFGPIMASGTYFTYADIKRRIGLKTNVQTKSWATFTKQAIINRYKDETMRKIRETHPKPSSKFV